MFEICIRTVGSNDIVSTIKDLKKYERCLKSLIVVYSSLCTYPSRIFAAKNNKF